MKKLSAEEISARLRTCSKWVYDGQQLVSERTLKDFQEAFTLLTKAALISEKLDHHAEIWNVYNKVHFKLSTHDAGGITEKDFTWINLLDGEK